MFRNYIKIAWRNIFKRKFYTAINIAGLALAITCCLFIYLYISFHLSFDRYHQRVGNTFRLVNELHLQKTEYEKGASVAMFKILRNNMPQVDRSAFAIEKQSLIIDVDGDAKRRFKEEKNIAFISSDWFTLFKYHWLAGNPKQLDEPNTVALTQKQANKYFGDANPIGRILTIKNQQVKVVGLIADAPFNSDLRSEIYISFASLDNILTGIDKGFYTDLGWINSTNAAYVSLKDARQKEAIEKSLTQLGEKKFGSKVFTFKLLPLTEMHFDAHYGGVVQQSLLVTLALIGALILIIAVINYINMTIAQQARRSVEIGTRKVLGGSSMQLFMQFMTESLLTAVMAIVIATMLVVFFMPAANNLLFTENPLHILSSQSLYLFLAVMLVFITLAAGVYPAMLLSRLSVFKALKNNAWNLKASAGRKVLIILQNTVAQALIAGTIIIVMQVRFLKNTDFGFDRNAVVMVPLGEATDTQKEQLSQSLKAISQVSSFSFCNKPPASDSQRGATVKFANRDWEKWPARFAIGDSAYCRTFGLTLVAGRSIRNKQPTPEFLINEKMATMLHFKNPNEVIGQTLLAGDVKGVIVGVVKDFNIKSLLEPIEPSVILENNYLQNAVAIKLTGNQTSSALSALQNQYQRILPAQLFSYQFVDDEIASLYKKESLQQKLIWSSAFVAIFISSLGLLGLISLVTLQRTKEIGIRKVLGATVSQINLMLSKDFLQLVLISLLIASPLAWWAMNKWLQSFAYRVDIHWWVFALAGFGALLIAILTISIQSVKAALANPVESLRSE
ncbi:ABC transporter permease [Mucilaginibacter sp. AW1-3]